MLFLFPLNVMCRQRMLELMQKIAGAGGVCATRFENRTYTDPNGNKRGHNHNRGVDAGMPIPVCEFKAGINDDESLTSLNKDIDWPSLYSDDRSTLAKCVRALQDAINKSLEWANKLHIQYHDGVSCCTVEAYV